MARRKGKLLEPDMRPMLATLVDKPFDDPEWIFEVKWDGYRVMAIIGDSARLYSRRGIDVTETYPPIARELSKTKKSAVIDGEVVALDQNGKPKFQLLQNFTEGRTTLVYYAFDLPYYRSADIRDRPLLERKKLLKELLPRTANAFRFSDHVIGKGKKFFAAAKKQGLEGIIAKRGNSPYRSGIRSRNWLKIKTCMRQEVVVLGFTAPRLSRKHIGSLVFGIREDPPESGWKYVGRSGGSMGGKSLKEVRDMLSPLVTVEKPFSEKIPDERTVTWVKPAVVCEVQFTEWTEGGQMRHPVIVGFRSDKKPEEVTHERKERSPASSKNAEQKFTNRDKVLWPGEGITKGNMLDYYDRVATYILPYLKDRPFVMNRHPNGIDKPNFYQKNSIELNLPSFVETTMVRSESTNEDIRYIVCNNKETLLYLANLGCIEMNPWNSRVKTLGKPDYYVIDLDPGNNTFEQVIEVARVTHKFLELSCETSFCKTSGKTGLHIYVPLNAKYPYEQVRKFAGLLVKLIHRAMPELTSVERSPAKRRSKIYLDFLQNRTGQTLAAAYSLRPAPGAPVSTPLLWKEVKKGLDPRDFTMATIFGRLAKVGDLWKPTLKKGVDLRKSIRCLEQEIDEMHL